MLSSSKITRLFLTVAVIGGVAVFATGCGKKDIAATQVVASVDGEEISVHQINGLFQSPWRHP